MNETHPNPETPTVQISEPPDTHDEPRPYSHVAAPIAPGRPPFSRELRYNPLNPAVMTSGRHNPSRPALGDDPAERVPITSVFGLVDAILRNPRQVFYHLGQPGAGRLVLMMIGVALVCSGVYGFVAGTFSGGMQLWAAPAKVVVGLLFSALICLPSLYIFACLCGARARLIEVCGLLSGLLMLMTILLVGFAPVAWIFSSSTESGAGMGFLHLLFGFIAFLFGMNFMIRGFVSSEIKTQSGTSVWSFMFMLVVLQMLTTLRPIIGTADTLLPSGKFFFLAYWWEIVFK